MQACPRFQPAFPLTSYCNSSPIANIYLASDTELSKSELHYDWGSAKYVVEGTKN